MEIVFATNNQNKLEEIQALLGPEIHLLNLKDIGLSGDLPEEQDTLEGNAFQKAKYVYDQYNANCFADDTGLEVDALNGAPGVYSARYAGDRKDAQDNMDKLLEELADKSNRRACFRTVISLLINGEEKRFDGVVQGTIIKNPRGIQGFGYDPVFQPDGYEVTFAEMPLDEKNKISHRSRAIKKLTHYLLNEL